MNANGEDKLAKSLVASIHIKRSHLVVCDHIYYSRHCYIFDSIKI